MERARRRRLMSAPSDVPRASGGDDAPVGRTEQVVRLLLVGVRNAVGLAGLLFFGWSAPTLVILYFADTLAGMRRGA